MNKMTGLILLSGAMLFVLGVCAAESFRAGAATGNITPELGGDIIGGFRHLPAKHVQDDLWVRCLVLDDGTTRVAFAVCDLLGVSRQTVISLERGRFDPSLPLAFNLATLFGCRIEDIFTPEPWSPQE